jgi:DNA-binding LacI/PurR family transcriptional regulator
MPDTLVRSKPLYRQLGSRLEAKILSGEFVAGDRLPTTQELATQFGVTIRTAQQAVGVLSERGLLERIPGRGTFVSRRILSRTIGVVFGRNVFAGSQFEFYQHVYGCLCTELKRQGWNTSLFFPTDDNAPEQMLAELGQDAAGDRLRGLIVLCRSEALKAWLDRHPTVPAGHDATTELGQRQQDDEIYRGVAYLIERGYRRLAVVAHMHATHLDAAARAYAERGLPMQATFHGGGAVSHATGVAQARAILDGPDGVPEAFLVPNDQGCMGVIFELLCRGRRIPADCGVMGVSNKGIEIPCPVPLTRLEHDPMNYAHRLIEETLALIEGRQPKPAPFESRLIVGESCGEGRSQTLNRIPLTGLKRQTESVTRWVGGRVE